MGVAMGNQALAATSLKYSCVSASAAVILLLGYQAEELSKNTVAYP